MEAATKKKAKFFPRFFRVFSIYFFITFAVFFGYVQIFGNVEPVKISLPTGGVSANDDDAFGDFVTNVMSLKSIKLDDVNLEFVTSDNSINLALRSDIIVVMDDMSISADIDLVYNDMVFDLGVVYADSNVYLTVEDKVYKYDVSGVDFAGMANFDFSSFDFEKVIGFVRQYISIDTTAIDNLLANFGIDLNNLDTDALMSQLKISSTENEDGTYLFNVKFSVIDLKIFTDEEFNITSVSMSDIRIDNNSLKFSVGDVLMNDETIGGLITLPEEYIDLTGLTPYVNYAQNLIENEKIEANITVDVDDKQYDAKVVVDFEDEVKAKANTVVEGFDIEVLYANEKVYLDASGLKLSFDINDVNVWKNKIETLVEKYTSKTVAEVCEGLIAKLKDKFGIEEIPSKEDIKEIALKKLLEMVAGSEQIAKALPQSFEETENSYTLVWENGLEITLKQENEILSEVYGKLGDYSAKIELAKSEEDIVVEEDKYYNISTLLPLVDFADVVYDEKAAFVDATISYKDFEASAKIALDIENRLAKISVGNQIKNIDIFVNEEKAYIVVDEIVLEAEIASLNEYLAKVSLIFGVEIPEIEAVEFDTNIDLEKIQNILQTLKLSSEGDLTKVEYLTHKANFKVVDGMLEVNYKNGDFAVSANVYAEKKEITIPAATDKLEDVLTKIENVKEFAQGKQFAAKISAQYKNIDIECDAKIDIENNIFAIYGLEIGQNNLDLIYKNDTVFVNYAGNMIKVSADKAKSLAEIVLAIASENGFEFETKDIDVSEILTEIFGEDVSLLSAGELIEKLTFSLSGSLNNLSADINLGTANSVSANVKVDFEENKLDTISISAVDANVSFKILPYTAIEIDEERFYDILSAQTGKLTVLYKDFEFEVDLKLDLDEKIYFEADTKLLGQEYKVVVSNNMLYVKAGEIVLGTNFNNAKELFEKIMEAFEIVLPESNFDFDIETLDLNKTNILDIVGLNFVINENGIAVNYEKNDLKLTANLDKGEVEVLEYSTYEEIDSLVEKAKNIKNMIETKLVEFDFDVEFNGFEVEGEFKYNGNVLELTAQAAGEDVYIRLENNVLYFAYGNMKLKFDVEKANSDNSFDFKETLEKLLGDDLPVRLQFGIFEDLLRMLKDYEIEDYLNNILVLTSGSTNDINISVSKTDGYVVEHLIDAKVLFENDFLKNVEFGLYDILSGKLSFNNVSQSTIAEFDAEKFEDYSADFISGVLDSLKVEEDVYAFTSNIDIRYSKNDFSAELVAMFKYDETADSLLGKFVPAIQIHTTALGFNSFVYIVDKTAYIDIQGLQISANLEEQTQGLQISANLEEQTLDEVLEFVETNFGVSLMGEDNSSAEAFKILLPALDKIYLSWAEMVENAVSYNGVQVLVDDALWYGADSRFENIILQAFIENYQNTIVPQKLVFGANVYDPNTIVYDDYSEYLLDIEEPQTSNLNFAVYLTNISVGQFIDGALDVFTKDENGNIVAVNSNYGVTNLSDFNSYKDVLTMVETIYDYANAMSYQGSVNASIKDSANKVTTLGANINVEIGDLTENEANTSGFKLFDNKYLKVQGAIDLNANSTEHLFNIFYESKGTSALYATYTHSPYLNGGSTIKQKISKAKKSFKAKINNTNLSEIFSMIVEFADLDLGEEMSENLGLTECTTDFSFVKSLIGMEETQSDDPTTQVDKILGSVEDVAKIIKNIKLETTETQTILTIYADIEKNDNVATISIILNNEENGQKLRKLVVSNLVYGGNTINLTIDFEDFSAANFDYNTSASHINFSEISSFVDTAVSTLNTKNFSFTGTISANVVSVVTVDMNVDMTASIDNDGKLSLYAQISFTKSTLAGLAFSGSFDKRYVVFEYKNDALTYTRYSQTSEKEGGFLGIGGKSWTKIVRDTSGTYASKDIGANIDKIIKNAFGFGDLAMNIVVEAIKNSDANPTVEEAILGFNKTSTGYTLKVSGENLLAVSGAKDMTLTLGADEKYNGFVNNEDGTTTDKKFSFISSIATQMNLSDMVIIDLNLKSFSGNSKTTEAINLKSSYSGSTTNVGSKTIYSNDYYRKQYINSVGGLY